MYRTIIQLTDGQKKLIAELCNSKNISQAALIREAVEEFIERHKPKPAGNVFGIWKNKDVDGLQYQNTLRQEWE